MTLDDIDHQLVRQHREHGILLDANLTVLLVVGLTSRARVSSHKRTRHYTVDDFDLLVTFCQRFPRMVTLPNVLTEASNHVSQVDERAVLKTICIDRWDEATCSSRHAASAREYSYLGLTDAAIIRSTVDSPLLLSADEQLVVAVLANSGAALHFDWLRRIAEST